MFYKLTRTIRDDERGTIPEATVYVNGDHIVSTEERPTGSIIFLSTGFQLHVAERPAGGAGPGGPGEAGEARRLFWVDQQPNETRRDSTPATRYIP